MITLYDYLPSQNAYKVRLLLNQLRQPYRTEIISIFEGEGQKEAFLRANPMGAVPAIQLEDGSFIAESNAILTFLADGSRFLPDDPAMRGWVMQWLFFEADYVQNGIASLRYWTLTGKLASLGAELVDQRRGTALRTLGVLERELAGRSFLAGADYTIADIAVFAYVHRTDEAGLPLAEYGNVVAWIRRVMDQPGYVAKVYPYSIDPHSRGEL
ncbi:MAG: glutathione S-transferase family protein [Alphaproteobacteria bacterium]|nr:glutathione S-transferase family protein [Alphaproteobacteria bacterium]